jgi:hypothetical protein
VVWKKESGMSLKKSLFFLSKVMTVCNVCGKPKKAIQSINSRKANEYESSEKRSAKEK